MWANPYIMGKFPTATKDSDLRITYAYYLRMSTKALVRAFLKYRQLLGELQSDQRAWNRIAHSLQHELVSFQTSLESYLASVGYRKFNEETRGRYWMKYRSEVDRGLSLSDLVLRDSLVLKEIAWKTRQAILENSVQASTWYLQNKCLIITIQRDFKDPQILFHDRCDSSDLQKRVKDALEIVYPEVLKKYEAGVGIEIRIEKNAAVGIWWTYKDLTSHHNAHPSTAPTIKHQIASEPGNLEGSEPKPSEPSL